MSALINCKSLLSSFTYINHKISHNYTVSLWQTSKLMAWNCKKFPGHFRGWRWRGSTVPGLCHSQESSKTKKGQYELTELGDRKKDYVAMFRVVFCRKKPAALKTFFVTITFELCLALLFLVPTFEILCFFLCIFHSLIFINVKRWSRSFNINKLSEDQ